MVNKKKKLFISKIKISLSLLIQENAQQIEAKPIIGRAIKKKDIPEASNANNSRFFERNEKVNKVATKQLMGKSQVR